MDEKRRVADALSSLVAEAMTTLPDDEPDRDTQVVITITGLRIEISNRARERQS